ncbi:hypothetical protein Glove_95g23 [Diversispora epigaea]|uniref:Uncharacterized protein n=1 Tax=Diversispora epigaea TaxID=1348612 RepID=A0A397J7B5_9GLOM|nr:hypothetical protein Glove_95g23 [Diversispora epigaea]
MYYQKNRDFGKCNEEIVIFGYDNGCFNEIYQIIDTDYENDNNYELDEEIDTEVAYMANEIETTDFVDSNDKLKEEIYTIPQETRGKLTACCVIMKTEVFKNAEVKKNYRNYFN